MTVDIDDTIAAIASANGAGFRGIVRLTGPDTVACVNKLFNIELDPRLSRQYSVALELGEGLALAGQLLVWPTQRSYTRQPSAEFHTLGSKPLLETVLKKFCKGGCRIARPGEFTLRAFLGGRLDLTQAEAVLAVIDSAHQTQFQVALQQLAGGLANPLSGVREQLIDLLAELEAGLDFVEEDIEFVSNEQLIESVDQCALAVDEIRQQIGSRATSDAAQQVVLVGWPNVGKSSLFNAMLGEDRAIVANVAGTTRDYVSAVVDRGGLKFELIDTAGLDDVAAGAANGLLKVEETDSRLAIDSAAQNASLEKLNSASLRLLCLDSNRGLNELEDRLIRELEGEKTLVVLTKCDLSRQIQFDGEYQLTSAVPGQSIGITALWDAICGSLMDGATEPAVISSTLSRCREHIEEVHQGLVAGKRAAVDGLGEEIVAAELRHALEHLGHVVGTIYTDDILDRIFGRFCIGK